VTNRLQRVINLINILEFTPAKSHTVAHCVANHLTSATTLKVIQKFTQVNSHSVAHCVANHLRGGRVWQSTIEKFILKKLIAVEVDASTRVSS
jgi:hypothetical protein